MRYIRAFFMSLGMFSSLPAPRGNWDDGLYPLVVPALPLVGLVIGGAWYGAALLLRLCSPPSMLHAAMLLTVPYLLCGLLHLDGFMDTADAVLSRRPLEERLRILKDPGIGAFAVVSVAILLLLQFSALFSLAEGEGPLPALVFIPVISRCAAGAALLNIKPLYGTGYMASFRSGTGPRHTVWLAALLAIVLAASALIGGPALLLPGAGVLAASAIAAAYLYRQLGGFNGDLCGCLITVGELGGLLCLALL